MLEKTRETLNNVKLRVVKYLTPLNYIEYSMKMCFIIKIKHLRMLSYLLLVFNLLMLLASTLFSRIINPASIFISMIITHLILSTFIVWRKRVKGVTGKSKEQGIIMRPFNLPEIDTPEILKQFKQENKESKND